MIKILKYGEVDNKQIFARCEALSQVGDIVADIIKTRIKRRNFYVPDEEHEKIIRFNELKMFPEKKHHEEYLQIHGFPDARLLDKSNCDG